MNLKVKDLTFLMSEARNLYINKYSRCTLEGLNRDLTDGESKALAFLEASLTIFNQYGILIPDWQKNIDLDLLQTDSDSIHEE